MPVDNYPHVRADGVAVTLGELRELVEAAALLPPDSVVRGTMRPFHMPDLGNPKGGQLVTVAIDRPTKTSTTPR